MKAVFMPEDCSLSSNNLAISPARDGDGIVRLGEVLDYVDITVRRETANSQHPAKAGTQFDRNLPMGVVK